MKRFDGTTWSSYAWPREKVVYDAWPRGMTIDSSGVLWVVFKDAIFKRSDTSWTIIDTADASTGLTNDMVYSLADIGGQKYSCIHTAPDGTVWILGNWTTPGSSGVMSLWLLKYSGSTWTMYNQTNSQIPRLVNESEIITDSEGNVWIWSYATSLSKFDGTYWTHYDKMMLAGTDVIPFAADRNGYVWLRGYNWVIQFDGDSALYYYAKDFDNDDTTEIDTIGGEVVQTVEGSYIGRRAQALDIAPNGEVWVGLKYYTYGNYAPPGGVARLVDTAWYHYTIENSGLPNNNVVYLSVDDAGNPWILTQDGSLTILDGSAPPGSVFNEPTSSVPSVTGNQSYAGHITIMPNPASSQATLRLHLPTTGQVRLRVVNSLGQQVALLLDEVRSAGDYGISVPVDALPAGTYFVQFTGSGISETCPLIVSE